MTPFAETASSVWTEWQRGLALGGVREIGPRMAPRLIKTIDRADGKAQVLFYERPDGLFEFCPTVEDEECGQIFWVPTDFSGVYDSLETAERDARAIVPWLREESSN